MVLKAEPDTFQCLCKQTCQTTWGNLGEFLEQGAKPPSLPGIWHCPHGEQAVGQHPEHSSKVRLEASGVVGFGPFVSGFGSTLSWPETGVAGTTGSLGTTGVTWETLCLLNLLWSLLGRLAGLSRSSSFAWQAMACFRILREYDGFYRGLWPSWQQSHGSKLHKSWSAFVYGLLCWYSLRCFGDHAGLCNAGHELHETFVVCREQDTTFTQELVGLWNAQTKTAHVKASCGCLLMHGFKNLQVQEAPDMATFQSKNHFQEQIELTIQAMEDTLSTQISNKTRHQKLFLLEVSASDHSPPTEAVKRLGYQAVRFKICHQKRRLVNFCRPSETLGYHRQVPTRGLQSAVLGEAGITWINSRGFKCMMPFKPSRIHSFHMPDCAQESAGSKFVMAVISMEIASACLLWPARLHESSQIHSVEHVQLDVHLELVDRHPELPESEEILMLRHEGPVAG